MTRLEKLIQQFCPDGVAYKSIQQCTCKAENIKWGTDSKEYQYIDLSSVDRETKRITDTQTITANNAPSRAQQIVKAGDILLGTTRPMLKRYCFVDERYDGQICSTGFCVLRTNGIVLSGWLYHQIASNDFFNYVEKNQKGASYPSISDASVKEYCIPVPPLEVQQEIVRILDRFTQLTAELTAELTARKQQYEYYQTRLFTYADNVQILPLAQIAEIGTGSSNTNEELEDGKYPFFVRSQDVRRKNTYEYDETAIITSGDGVGVGKIFHYVEGKYALHQRAYRIHIIDDRIIPRFYYYYMKCTFLPYIEKASFHSSVTSIRRPMLNNFPVPLIPLPEQRRIVAILDRFDALCNDLTSGLPAEIAARQKQYEYYRDKLLTFPEHTEQR